MTAPFNAAHAAQMLDEAARDASAIDQLGLEVSSEQAYQIQAASIDRRLVRGEKYIGLKMGMTSRAKMAQIGITEVIWGRLTDAMVLPNGGTLAMDRHIHPRAEPEIAFRLCAPLSGEITEKEAWAAVDGIAPAVEIIDSRFRDFKFNLADAIADNCSSSSVILGPWHPPSLGAGNLHMEMLINDESVGIGCSSAILGHPIRSLIEAARLTARYGGSLSAGDIFMSGASMAAVPLQVGMQVKLRVQHLGECEFQVAATLAAA